MAAPSVPNTRQARARPAATRERRGGIILAPIAISDRAEMTRVAGLLGDEVARRGVAPALVWTAFATLVDNALTHGSKRVPPVAAVYLAEGAVTISSRDLGQAFADCADAKGELRRRIQLPAEDADPTPGSPAGIPWLARLLTRRCPTGYLTFRAGDGRLSFRRGVWACQRADRVEGFVAIARLPLL